MKWILVWWVVHPWHSQVMHLEHGFPSESACLSYATSLQAPASKVIRKHCSME
jgi:hypothetical protein